LKTHFFESIKSIFNKYARGGMLDYLQDASENGRQNKLSNRKV